MVVNIDHNFMSNFEVKNFVLSSFSKLRQVHLCSQSNNYVD